ncbi:MAG: magnesium/cobalt transporter CorA [Alphaproteobacteria bacterium]|nr:magnesium/cobalt transporter CorA [Alphaproteobacteria bacterium]
MASPSKRRPAADKSARRGLMPGAPIYTGAPRDGQVTISVLHYGADGVREAPQVAPGALAPLVKDPDITWIDVAGVHQAEVIQQICEVLGIHPLAMEDVLNPTTRPKVDIYDDHVLVCVRMLRVLPGEGERDLDIESVAMVLGPRWVVTFQERPGDLWDGVRERIRSGRGRIRQLGPDYLLHALLDAIVDGLFEVLSDWEVRVEDLEDEALGMEAERDLPRRVHRARSRLNAIRRLLIPAREGVHRLLRGETPMLTAQVRPYFNDLTDHLDQALDLLDASRDRLLGALDIHLNLASHRMNETMRVLTVVATIFMPITFVAGIYGMNFDNMPELHWVWAYPTALGTMALISVVMLAWFHKRGWL